MIIPGWIGGRMVKWMTKITITDKESDNYYHFFDNRILPPQVDKEIADKDGWWVCSALNVFLWHVWLARESYISK